MLATQKHELLTQLLKLNLLTHVIRLLLALGCILISKLNACFEGALQTYQVTHTQKLPLLAQSRVTI